MLIGNLFYMFLNPKKIKLLLFCCSFRSFITLISFSQIQLSQINIIPALLFKFYTSYKYLKTPLLIHIKSINKKFTQKNKPYPHCKQNKNQLNQ